jgi:hypothetical protein
MRWSFFAVLLCVWTLHAPVGAESQRPTLAWANEQAPIWQGVLADEVSTADAGMLYPGQSGASFLAGLLTHGVLLQLSRSKQQNARRQDADKVVAPYLPLIAAWSQTALMAEVEQRLASSHSRLPKGSHVEMAAVFYLSPDERSLTLHNVVSVSTAGGPATSRVVRVLGVPITATNPREHWSSNSAEALRVEAIQMLAHSADVWRYQADPVSREQTHRYQLGTEDLMERGRWLGRSCDRIYIETLRGWVLSAPTVPDSAAACVPEASDL